MQRQCTTEYNKDEIMVTNCHCARHVDQQYQRSLTYCAHEQMLFGTAP